MPSWTTPADWSTQERVLASKLNAQLRDNLKWLKSRPFANVVMTATVNTTSTSFVELTESRITFTSAGGNIFMAACGIFSNSITGTINTFDLAIDGTRQGDATVGLTQITCPNNNYPDCLSLLYMTSSPPSADSHTYSIYWKVSANTGTILTRFAAIEIR